MRKPDILSRWLHVGMASCIVLCTLFFIGGMDGQAKQISAGLIFFNLHKFVGINFIVIGTIYLLWSAKKQGKPLSQLFPWFDAAARGRLMREVRQLAKLRNSRIAYMLTGLLIYICALELLFGVWSLWHAGFNHDIADNPLTAHKQFFLLLSVAAYFIPWMLPGARAGLRRELRRLRLFETGHIASAIQGVGVASALLACWLGLFIVMFSIAGVKFTTGMLLPQAHIVSSYAVMAYLIVHAGAAALHGLAGHTEIFAIGKLLERTIQLPIYGDTQGLRG